MMTCAGSRRAYKARDLIAKVRSALNPILLVTAAFRFILTSIHLMYILGIHYVPAQWKMEMGVKRHCRSPVAEWNMHFSAVEIFRQDWLRSLSDFDQRFCLMVAVEAIVR